MKQPVIEPNVEDFKTINQEQLGKNLDALLNYLDNYTDNKTIEKDSVDQNKSEDYSGYFKATDDITKKTKNKNIEPIK